MTISIGQQLGNYRLIQLLGKGGFADVYLAEHSYLGTYAAIKVLDMRLTSDNIELFSKEARTIASLVHPHILRVLDFGIERGIPFLVMDYAPNGTLRQRHPRGSLLSVDTVISYVKQIASALQYIHERKLIHRDIKPENLLIGRNGEILISDFGIAVMAHSSRCLNTEDASGTVYYMAPEQIQGKPRMACCINQIYGYGSIFA
jgi:serine/threonine protein kinase